MKDLRFPLARPALWVLGLAALALAALVARPSIAQTSDPLPIEHFFPWDAWTAKSPPNTFDLNRCANMQAADANGDGLTDLVCAYNYGGNETRTWVQTSTGAAFSGWGTSHPTFLTGFDVDRCRPLLSGDLNNDGRADLICPYDYGSAQTATWVQLSLAAGYTAWQQWAPKTATNTFDLNRCANMQAADANGDGLTDLICAYNYGGNETRTFIQTSSGSDYTSWENQHPAVLTGFDVDRCRPLLSGDLNNDGRTDLICPYDYGSAQTATFVQLSLAAGYTAWQQWAPKTATNTFDLNRCQNMQAADANGDGLTDLVCAYNYGGNETRTFVQTSSGSDYTGWVNQHPAVLTGFDVDRCRPLLSGDLNNDGRADLICPYDYGSAQTATFVQISRPAGYTAWQRATDTTGTGIFNLNSCANMRAGDANGDGHTDLICPYDYGSAQTATFVQAARLYRVDLPTIIR